MYAIGYDIGSSSIKAALVNLKTGKCETIVQLPEKEMDIIAKKIGWAEQNPEIWWRYVCQATKLILQKTKINPNNITDIGISYQMHGLITLDKNGNPVRDAIIWCDSRAVDIGQKALNDLGSEKCALNLLNSPANFTASKLRWVKENEPENFSKTFKFMLPGDYIAYKLSGSMQTTASGLSEGILWDFNNNSIAGFLLDYYGIPESMIPELVPTFSSAAKVSKKGAAETGLVEGTRISYRSGDQPNNALSLNVFNPGETAATGGTSGVVYAITDQLSSKEITRINSFAHVNHSATESRIGKLLNINGAGISFKWLKSILNIDDYTLMNQEASTSEIGSAGLCCFPFGNGSERMFYNRQVHGHFHDINFNIHDRSHLIRATLEGIAFSFVYGMEILKQEGVSMDILKVGNDNLFRSEIFSNTIAHTANIPIEVYNTTGAIGAARACLMTISSYDEFSEKIKANDYIKTYNLLAPNIPYKDAYENWKNKLTNILK
ncbi:xylulokinase [Zhouia amylolytica]|uniref:xylulokinase n=1 Tax=Zhouia amylolytica TaxID=376730 RepID=UPI0020CB8806|nr:FGGY family carbohydrate kinase [Zhouia amylolytica]MCQ0110020.1 carbohydrate kinase [Zhouia amylolytica]